MCVRSVLVPVGLLAESDAAASIQVSQIASGVPNLVDIEHAGDGSNRLFPGDRNGRILVYTGGSSPLPTPFLDISSISLFAGEQGLLGLAFHPNYENNVFFYVNCTNKRGPIVELRAALAEAYRAAMQPEPNHVDANLGGGTAIRAIHIAELRSAVRGLEKAAAAGPGSNR